MTREAVIVAGLRTAVGRSKKGTTRNWRSDDMTAAVIAELMKRTGVDPALIDDVVVGCAMPEGVQGLNFARSIVLRAGMPVEVPGMTVNRFCSSGLQTIAQSAERGSYPLALAAADPQAEPGAYYGPTRFGDARGPVGKSFVAEVARDEDVARKLWERTEELVGTFFPE